MRLTVQTGSSGSTSVGGKILISLFLSVFLLMGLIFMYLVGRGLVAAARTYAWKPTSCRILESRVVDAAGGSKTQPFLFEVLYRYEFGGQAYESRRYKSTYTGSEQIGDAQRLATRFPAGSQAVCFVNPESPENACLERPSLWMGLILLLPLVFVLVGGVGIVAVWSTREKKPDEILHEAISEKAKSSRMGPGCLIGFFAIFLFAGAGTSLFFIRPALRNLEARSWPEVPCVVLSSQVRSHSGSNGSTYSVDILYEYAVAEKNYRSNRYQFLGGSSGGYDSKAAIVAANPPGTRRICYVNPADPNDAVLTRSFTKEYAIVLVPLLFLAVGLGGILFAIRGMRRTGLATSAGDDAIGQGRLAPAGTAGFTYADETLPAGPVVLKSSSPLAKLLGTIFIALFWNGIVSVFVWQMIKGWRQGQAPACLTLFLIPFVVIGVAFIGGIGYYFLALFNPRPIVRLSSRAIPLGGKASLDWTFSGAASRIMRLRIEVEGREEATYRRGTSTSTDRNTFATIPVFDAQGLAGGERSGSATFSIPADTMHSFSAPNNRIVWSIKLQGEIPKWPDVSEQYELDVRPSRQVGSS